MIVALLIEGADVAIKQPIPQGPRALPAQLDDETTRLLCAKARLTPEFADWVVSSIAAQPYQAIAPAYGVDLLALARHATRTRRMLLRRNLAHTVLLLAGLVALVVVVRGVPGATLALAVIGAVPVLGWLLEFAELWTARREALTLVEPQEQPVSLAPPIDPDLEHRLIKLDRMNVVLYGTRRYSPFVGSGLWVAKWSIPPVDVTRAARDDQGQKRAVIPLDAVQLNDHMATALRTRGPEGLQVSTRLYVRGHLAPHIPGVLDGRLRTPDGRPRAPEPIVDPEVIESALLRPRSAIEAYLCLEKITFGGELAVSMFAHTVVERNVLAVRADCFFLPPLHRSSWTVNTLPREPLRVLAKTISNAGGAFPHDLVAAPGQLVRYWLRHVGHRRRAAGLAHRIRRDRAFDYGAASGLREVLADLAEANHVELANEERYLRMLQRQVIDAIIEFLDGHNVDTSDLRKQQGDIVNNTTYNFQGDVGGVGHHFGSHGQVDNRPAGPSDGNPAGWRS